MSKRRSEKRKRETRGRERGWGQGWKKNQASRARPLNSHSSFFSASTLFPRPPPPPPQHHHAGFHAEGHPALRAHHFGLAVSAWRLAKQQREREGQGERRQQASSKLCCFRSSSLSDASPSQFSLSPSNSLRQQRLHQGRGPPGPHPRGSRQRRQNGRRRRSRHDAPGKKTGIETLLRQVEGDERRPKGKEKRQHL